MGWSLSVAHTRHPVFQPCISATNWLQWTATLHACAFALACPFSILPGVAINPLWYAHDLAIPPPTDHPEILDCHIVVVSKDDTFETQPYWTYHSSYWYDMWRCMKGHPPLVLDPADPHWTLQGSPHRLLVLLFVILALAKAARHRKQSDLRWSEMYWYIIYRNGLRRDRPGDFPQSSGCVWLLLAICHVLY